MMSDSISYGRLYDMLRQHGYHQHEDETSHLAPYIPWMLNNLQFRSVLDIGCGAGGSFSLFPSGCEVSGIDVSSLAVAKGRAAGRNVVQASATKLPFADSSFDLVVSADVFEHLHPDDARSASLEALRVARRFVFMKIAQEVDVSEPWKRLAGHPLHLTTQSLTWWLQFFEGSGAVIHREPFVFCLQLHRDQSDPNGSSLA